MFVPIIPAFVGMVLPTAGMVFTLSEMNPASGRMFAAYAGKVEVHAGKKLACAGKLPRVGKLIFASAKEGLTIVNLERE